MGISSTVTAVLDGPPGPNSNRSSSISAETAANISDVSKLIPPTKTDLAYGRYIAVVERFCQRFEIGSEATIWKIWIENNILNKFRGLHFSDGVINKSAMDKNNILGPSSQSHSASQAELCEAVGALSRLEEHLLGARRLDGTLDEIFDARNTRGVHHEDSEIVFLSKRPESSKAAVDDDESHFHGRYEFEGILSPEQDPKQMKCNDYIDNLGV